MIGAPVLGAGVNNKGADFCVVVIPLGLCTISIGDALNFMVLAGVVGTVGLNFTPITGAVADKLPKVGEAENVTGVVLLVVVVILGFFEA